MANLDYTAAPGVEARTSAPDDTQSIQANPDAFGAGLDQSTAQLGQSAIDASKFYGQVAADNGYNNVLQQGTNILHGDPSKQVMGPDGQPTGDTGYLGMRGADAMSARADTGKALDDIIQKNRATLSTPQAQLQYDNDTRRLRTQWQAQVGTHADEQQQVWAKQTNENTATLGLNSIALNAGNDAAITPYVENVRKAYVRTAQIQYGNDPAVAQGAVLHADQQIALTRISALSADPSTAQDAERVFESSKGVLGSLPNYDAIGRQVKGAVINATMAPAIDQAVQEATASARSSVGTGAPQTPPPDMSAVPFAQVKPQIMAHAAPESIGGYNAQAYNTANGGNAAGLKQANLTGMTIGQVIDYQNNVMRPATAGKRGAGDVGSTGVGAYQFESGTLAQNAQATLGANWRDQPFSAGNQDKIAEHLYNSVRGDPNALGNTWAAFAGQKGGQYPSVPDALNANMGGILNKAQSDAERLFPNYPDAQDRYVEGVRRRIEQTVSQQHQQYEVDTHIVQGVMAGDNPPISEGQLLASSPQVAQAWRNMQINSPMAALSVERMFDANAKGRAAGYGSEFKTYLDRVLAPQDDPNRVMNPSQLWGFVGTGANSPLTNSGVNQLSNLLQGRGTPQGEADAAQMRQFVDTMHAQLTFTNKGTGVYDAKGEAKFGQYMAATLPVLANAQKNGNLAAVLNPASKDYIGASAQTFMRNPVDLMKDRGIALSGATTLPQYTPQTLGRTLDELDNDAQRKDALKAAVAQKRISVQDATIIGMQRGYIQGHIAANAPVDPLSKIPFSAWNH